MNFIHNIWLCYQKNTIYIVRNLSFPGSSFYFSEQNQRKEQLHFRNFLTIIEDNLTLFLNVVPEP